MTTISSLTAVNYTKPRTLSEGLIQNLSNYFYLGGKWALVVKDTQVELKDGAVSWVTIALKVSAYVVLFPLTLTLLAINLALRSRYHFTIATPSNNQPIQAPNPIFRPTPTFTPTPINSNIFSSNNAFSLRVANQSIDISSHQKLEETVSLVLKKVNDEHSALRLIFSLSNVDLHNNPEARSFLSKLEATTNVQFKPDIFLRAPGEVGPRCFYDLEPKPITEELTKAHKVFRYSSGIVEYVQSGTSMDWDGTRIYPNHVKEIGHFTYFRWDSGVSIKEGVITQLKSSWNRQFPETINFIGFSDRLNEGLVEIDIEGEKKILVITKEKDRVYSPVTKDYLGTFHQLLLEKDTKFYNHSMGPLHSLSKYIDIKSLIQSLVNDNRVCDLQVDQFTEILDLMQTKNWTFDFQHQSSKNGTSLLEKYLPHLSSNHHRKFLLNLQPSLIKKVEGKPSILTAFLYNKEGFLEIVNSMNVNKIALTPSETILKKLVLKEGLLTQQDFASLSTEDQQSVWRHVNWIFETNYITMMRDLGWGRKNRELLMAAGPSILAWNMDALEKHDTILRFLKTLRSNKLLLTKEEFKQLPREGYISKGDDIGRILGRDYLEKKINELNLHHVKVPKKLVVIEDSTKPLEFKTRRQDITPYNSPDSNFNIYAEKIDAQKRTITLEEVSELLRLFDETGFHDRNQGNIILAKDGVYIIDTEFTNFCEKGNSKDISMYNSSAWDIPNLLPSQEGSDSLRKDYLDKIKLYEKKEETYTREFKIIEDLRTKHSEPDARCFSFTVEELLNP